MRKFIATFVFLVGLLPLALKAEEKMTPEKKEIAIFSMGCFWCGESEFRDHETGKPLPGILSLRVGYAGGTNPNPTYESHKGYKESVKIEFDPTIISYNNLLDMISREEQNHAAGCAEIGVTPGAGPRARRAQGGGRLHRGFGC